MIDLKQLDRETLEGMVTDFAKNWLAHDGLWFLGIEDKFDMETAIEIDRIAWQKFTVIEAKRIMTRHDIGENSGLEGLKKALEYRLYAVLNKQEIKNETENSFEFYMVECRVQTARKRKNLPLFPCKTVGVEEYAFFAKTIDPRISCDCIGCPPDENAGIDFYCGWKFSIKE
jgi:hypothetical protein